jgi:two-component system OmpR family sensor kinase
MNEPRPARFGPPLAVPIIALLVAVLIIGQLATLAVILMLPPPRPPVYRVDDVSAALKGEQIAPRYGPKLVRSTAAAPPVEQPGERFRVAGLKLQLARLLGVSEDRVRLVIEPRPVYDVLFGGGRPRRARRGNRALTTNAPDFGGPPQPPPGEAIAPPNGAPPPPPPMDGPSFAPPPSVSPGPPPDDRASFWMARRHRGGWYGSRGGGPQDRVGVIVGELEAAYQPQQGPWIVVRTQSEGFPNAWQRRIMLWFLACLLILTPVGYLFARRLTAPIRRFAAAADRLGRDPSAPAMSLRGPAEIGRAASAFNEMQARLARYVEDRTAMIAAIAHDLRTPLTRVQFKLRRAPADVAADIRTDLDQMEAMIAAVLAFVRDASPTQERGPLELLSLLEVVADDASATGSDVEVEPGPALIVDGDASALQRLFVNLVDNAVKYGDRARIRLSSDAAGAVVEIIDNGRGLLEAERDRVFEPFYRIEGSRNRDTGGIGLGLSIARSIARAHGGDVSLEPADPGPGLKAVVRLPVAKASG